MRYRSKSTSSDAFEVAGFFLLSVSLLLATVGAWVRHIFWTVSTLASDEGVTVGQGVLAILGALFAPLGMVHGWSLWLGYSWQ